MSDEKCEHINAIKIAELEKRLELHVRYQKEAMEKADSDLLLKINGDLAGRLWAYGIMATIAGGAIGAFAAYLLK